MIDNPDTGLEAAQIRKLRRASLLEGTTLLVLIGIAVPLKHFAHLPQAVAVMGPLHGAVFMLYVWVLLGTVSSKWSRLEIARLVVAALIPFGTFANARWLKRKEAQLAEAEFKISSVPQR